MSFVPIAMCECNVCGDQFNISMAIALSNLALGRKLK